MKIGYTCLLTPVELLSALGLKPFRLIPKGLYNLSSCGGKESYLRYDACPYLTNLYNGLLEGDWDWDGIFLLTLCDGQRRLGEILERVFRKRIFTIYSPRTYHDSAFQLFLEEIKDFVKVFLKDGKKLKKRLLAEVEKRNEIKKMMMRRWVNFDFLTRANFALTFYERNEFHLSGSLTKHSVSRASGHDSRARFRVFLLGSYFSPPDWKIIPYIQEHFKIAGDAFCTVTRGIDLYPTAHSLEDYLAFYFYKIPCIMRRPNDFFYDYLKRKMKGVDGIILKSLKFCDPFGMEKKRIEERLNLPVLQLETSYTEETSLQLKTRIAAFASTLKGK